ncbi:MAG: hypothetical protein AB4063_21750 [Crocosphaera sp.]
MITDPTRIKLASYTFLTISFCIVRSFRKKDVNLTNSMDVMISLGGIVLAVSLLIRAFDSQVSELLQEDIIAVATASIAQAIASISLEIKHDVLFLLSKFTKIK